MYRKSDSGYYVVRWPSDDGVPVKYNSMNTVLLGYWWVTFAYATYYSEVWYNGELLIGGKLFCKGFDVGI